MELEKGDYVLVRKPDNIKEYPTWNTNMDIFNSKIMKIQKFHRENDVILTFATEYSFSTKWLIKV